MTSVAIDTDDLKTQAEAAKGEGRPEAAADLFNQSGNAHLREGRSAEAIEAYGAALSAMPDFTRSMSNMGIAYAQLGQPDEALKWFRKAYEQDRSSRPSLLNLTKTLRKLGRTEELYDLLQDAHACSPGEIFIMKDLAILLSRQGHHVDAAAWYRKSLDVDARDVRVWCLLANELKEQGDFAGALDCVDQAEAVAREQTGRNDPAAIATRAFVLLHWGKPEQALEILEDGITQFPSDSDLGAAMAGALEKLQRWEESKTAFERVLAGGGAWDPLMEVAYASVLFQLGKHDHSLEVLDEVIRKNPELLNARFPQAELLLRLGRYEEGWTGYEYRSLHASGIDVDHKFPQPLWQGEAPEVLDGPLLVITEQGYGDALQFSRYVPLLAEQGYNILFEVMAPLERLYRESFFHPRLKIIPRLETPGSIYKDLPFAAWISVMSLPHRFGTTLETIPSKPYLTVPESRLEYWRTLLLHACGEDENTPHRTLKVGLVWAGDSRPDNYIANRTDARRSLALEQFAPLAAIPGISWVSLQKGGPAEQAKHPPPGMDLIDIMDEVGDFADTAAIMKTLDLIITVDTSMVHLAGGLGMPVWILSRYDGCWRWLLERSDSPWYPSARLFRQKIRNDWQPVIEDVRQALQTLTAERCVIPGS